MKGKKSFEKTVWTNSFCYDNIWGENSSRGNKFKSYSGEKKSGDLFCYTRINDVFGSNVSLLKTLYGDANAFLLLKNWGKYVVTMYKDVFKLKVTEFVKKFSPENTNITSIYDEHGEC